MSDQYFTREPGSESRPAECSFTYRGKELHFLTDAGVFSRGELDTGTRLLLEALPERLTEKSPERPENTESPQNPERLKRPENTESPENPGNPEILDLGCGWGPIGISVKAVTPEARVTMADVNLRALSLSRENAKRNGTEVEILESDGFSALTDRSFDTVITNPPIRAGKQVIYQMFADAREHLKAGGSLFLVIRKQQGAESCVRYLKTLYASVEKRDRSGGFWVLEARKE